MQNKMNKYILFTTGLILSIVFFYISAGIVKGTYKDESRICTNDSFPTLAIPYVTEILTPTQSPTEHPTQAPTITIEPSVTPDSTPTSTLAPTQFIPDSTHEEIKENTSAKTPTPDPTATPQITLIPCGPNVCGYK